MTGVILLVMVLVVLSYREIVMVYIRPGGSYVVARQNLGPRIAQICAVALLIDYIVTVAVQVAAGTAAIASVFPVVGTYKVEISAGIILLMCYGNLRGLKEAGRAFAVPTYLFAGSVILMIIVGLIREVAGHLTPYDPRTLTNHYAIGAGDSALISGVMIFTLLRAFANGGASLTGIEAVSDAVARSGRRRAATPARSWWLRDASWASWWRASPGSRTRPTRRRGRPGTRPCWPRRPS